MLKALVGAILLVATAALVAVVPLRGRTVLERWRAAPTAGAFVERAWAEVRNGSAAGVRAERPARPARPPTATTRARTPTEHHTAEDRAALDRIVTEHAGR